MIPVAQVDIIWTWMWRLSPSTHPDMSVDHDWNPPPSTILEIGNMRQGVPLCLAPFWVARTCQILSNSQTLSKLDSSVTKWELLNARLKVKKIYIQICLFCRQEKSGGSKWVISLTLHIMRELVSTLRVWEKKPDNWLLNLGKRLIYSQNYLEVGCSPLKIQIPHPGEHCNLMRFRCSGSIYRMNFNTSKEWSDLTGIRQVSVLYRDTGGNRKR